MTRTSTRRWSRHQVTHGGPTARIAREPIAREPTGLTRHISPCLGREQLPRPTRARGARLGARLVLLCAHSPKEARSGASSVYQADAHVLLPSQRTPHLTAQRTDRLRRCPRVFPLDQGLTLGLSIGLTLRLTLGRTLGLTIGLTLGLTLGLTPVSDRVSPPRSRSRTLTAAPSASSSSRRRVRLPRRR